MLSVMLNIKNKKLNLICFLFLGGLLDRDEIFVNEFILFICM